jgi:hypothetical protein
LPCTAADTAGTWDVYLNASLVPNSVIGYSGNTALGAGNVNADVQTCNFTFGAVNGDNGPYTSVSNIICDHMPFNLNGRLPQPAVYSMGNSGNSCRFTFAATQGDANGAGTGDDIQFTLSMDGTHGQMHGVATSSNGNFNSSVNAIRLPTSPPPSP